MNRVELKRKLIARASRRSVLVEIPDAPLPDNTWIHKSEIPKH